MKPDIFCGPSAKRGKRLCAMALLCALCFALTGCSVDRTLGNMYFLWLMSRSDDHMTYSGIERLILENRDALEEDIPAGRAAEWEGRLGIESVSEDESGHIDFFCGGWGIVPEGGYTGFYYSPDDQPFDIMHFTDGPLTPYEGGWVWEADEGSDNTFRTRRVTEGFFWYEYHF